MSMDALGLHRKRTLLRLVTLAAAALAVALLTPRTLLAAPYRTANFVVTAPTESIARQVGKTAEQWRKRLAVQWLGKEMPQWYRPCTVHVRIGQIGAGGATTFSFNRGHVFGWNMRVQGTLERVLDSVVPHEVSHTVFASHFRRPLPRWADEGAATLAEHESEQRVQLHRLKQAVGNNRRIPFRQLLPMKEYPRGMQQVLLLYAEGFSLADFLVQQKGRPAFLQFLDDAYRNGWDDALNRHYKIESVERLEKKWHGWFMAGSPRLNLKKGEMVASRRKETQSGRSDTVVIRSQTPDAEERKAIAIPVAPDPRRNGRSHSTGTPDHAIRVTDGRLRALRDGWIPVKRTVRKGLVNSVTSFQPQDLLEFFDASMAGAIPSPRDRDCPDRSAFPHCRDSEGP